VNEVTFGETSAGAAMVQGSFVGQGASEYRSTLGHVFFDNAYAWSGSAHARMGGPFGNRGSSESREQTIANGTSLNLPGGRDILIRRFSQLVRRYRASLRYYASPTSCVSRQPDYTPWLWNTSLRRVARA
jgi:hypothetical protein